MLPSLSIDSPTNNIHHLTDIDADINMPFDNNFAYYTHHDFHNNFDISQCFSNNQSFSIINCNIRSLSTNFDSLTNMLSNLYFSFSLIGLTETKIKSDQTQIVNTDLPGYQFLSQPTLSDWGGVAFYIKDNLHFKVRPDLSSATEDFETLWIEIHNYSHSNLLCGIIYRHPNSNLGNFLDYLNLVTDKISRESKFCTIQGDFDLDLLKFESHLVTDDFLNTLGSYFFQPHILQPTRITDHSATLIDNIFFNSIEHFTVSGNLVYDLTDHLANFLIFDKFSSLPSNIKLYKRDFSNFNQQVLLDDMQSVDWHGTVFDSIENPSDLLKSFYTKLSSVIDVHIPLKQLLDCAGDGKMIWKGIKQIVHCKPPISQRSIKLVENGNEISDSKEIANKFNDYFANIGKSIIASEIPIACKDPMAYLGNPVCNSFYFQLGLAKLKLKSII